jgi:hypothetical protein
MQSVEEVAPGQFWLALLVIAQVVLQLGLSGQAVDAGFALLGLDAQSCLQPAQESFDLRFLTLVEIDMSAPSSSTRWTQGNRNPLSRYPRGEARRYFLIYEGRRYDSKAVAGVAFGYQLPDVGPLTRDELSGGENTVQRKLEALGFELQGLPA